MVHICVGNLATIGLNKGLSPSRRRAIIWTNAKNKLRWYFNRNSYIFIQESAFKTGVWKMAAILSRPQYVNVISFDMSAAE